MMRASLGVVTLSLLTLCAACEDDSGQDESTSEQLTQSNQAQKAKLQLKNASSTVAQTSSTGWTLSKTGSLDEPSSTITWVVTAAPNGGTSRRLVVNGKVTIKNTGNGPATIGNLIVSLQAKQTNNKWQTVSHDITDGTIGDAATKAIAIRQGPDDDDNSDQVDDEDDSTNGPFMVTTYNESPSSGSLTVTPAIGTIAPGATVNVTFVATYNNDVLGLAVGRKVRALTLVTFGKSGTGNHTSPNIDINGSGAIEPFEARVRTVSARLGQKLVPAATSTPTPVTLTDTLADISTTGSVTFTHPVFNIGATSGTVQVTVDGGDVGGTVKNCAHLTGTNLSLEACNTQAVAANPFEWADGDVITYPQEAWGDLPNGTNAASILITNYSTVYASTFGQIEAGISGAAGNSMLFSGAPFVLAYLPATGPSAALLSDTTNPLSTTSGAFGGDVLALKFDVDFSDAGVTGGTIAFGDALICGVPSLSALDGMSVRSFLGLVNTLLGGGTAVYTINDVAILTDELTNAFTGGVVSQFARDHLTVGACH